MLKIPRNLSALRVLIGISSLALFVPSTGHAYEVLEVKDGGTIEGTVTFTGTPPPPRKLLVTKDPEVCGTGERVMEDVSVTEGGALRHVVVYLDGIEQGKDWNGLPNGAKLEQRGCAFLPEIAIVPQGKELAITNSDPVPHNIHTYEVIGRARRSLFNVAQPQPSTITKAISPRNALTVKVECDLHNFMEGWLFVAATPYVALVDADGRFSLRDVPSGTYTLKAWHPTLGTKEVEVQVEAGQATTASLAFSAP